MNEKQLYASCTPEEHLENLILMLQKIEAHQSQFILSRGRLIRERRKLRLSAHFIHDRRNRIKPSAVVFGYFLFIFAIASVGVMLSAFHFPPHYAAPLMLVYLSAFAWMLFIKPHSWKFIYEDSPFTTPNMEETKKRSVFRCDPYPKRSEVRILSPRHFSKIDITIVVSVLGKTIE